VSGNFDRAPALLTCSADGADLFGVGGLSVDVLAVAIINEDKSM